MNMSIAFILLLQVLAFHVYIIQATSSGSHISDKELDGYYSRLATYRIRQAAIAFHTTGDVDNREYLTNLEIDDRIVEAAIAFHRPDDGLQLQPDPRLILDDHFDGSDEEGIAMPRSLDEHPSIDVNHLVFSDLQEQSQVATIFDSFRMTSPSLNAMENSDESRSGIRDNEALEDDRLDHVRRIRLVGLSSHAILCTRSRQNEGHRMEAADIQFYRIFEMQIDGLENVDETEKDPDQANAFGGLPGTATASLDLTGVITSQSLTCNYSMTEGIIQLLDKEVAIHYVDFSASDVRRYHEGLDIGPRVLETDLIDVCIVVGYLISINNGTSFDPSSDDVDGSAGDEEELVRLAFITQPTVPSPPPSDTPPPFTRWSSQSTLENAVRLGMLIDCFVGYEVVCKVLQ